VGRRPELDEDFSIDQRSPTRPLDIRVATMAKNEKLRDSRNIRKNKTQQRLLCGYANATNPKKLWNHFLKTAKVESEWTLVGRDVKSK